MLYSNDRGCSRCNLCEERKVSPGDAIFVPTGTRLNLTNTGGCPLKLYSVYSPPTHPRETVHATRAEADAEEH